jgi:hypothetical protein
MRSLTKNILGVVLMLTMATSLSCKNANRYTSPSGYDFKKGDKFNMPSSLLEISGITFHNGKSDTVYSIQDEDGKLYKQQWDVKKQKNVKFASKGDFEDLAVIDSNVIVLKSNGSLYVFSLKETNEKETKEVREFKNLFPKAEYESIYADQPTGNVYVLCKSCPQDKKNKQVTGYQLKYDHQTGALDSSATFVINLKPIPDLNAKLKANLNPSAMAKNTMTDEF